MKQGEIIAVAYYRYSSHAQSEQSIEGQRHDCETFAERSGIKIIKEYIDRATSAKTDNRPQFQKMINDAANGKFNAVIVWKLDRFARNRYDSAYNKGRLAKYGVKLISAMEQISDSPEGILIESLLEGMAEYYSAELAQKVKRGTRESALKCKVLGPLPLGYKKSATGEYEIDEIGASAVRLIFNRYNDGFGCADIIKELNNKGYRNSKGGKFTHNSIYSILQNIRYTGVYKYDDIEIPGGIPRIISDEQFKSAQLKKNHNRTTKRRHTDEREYPLTSYLYCGECGTMMIGMSGYNKNNNKYHYYACKNRRKGTCSQSHIRAEYLEDLIYKELLNNVLKDDTVEEIADAIMRYLGSAPEKEKINVLEHNLRETQSKLDNIMFAIENGVITKSTTDRLHELEEIVEQLNYEIIKEKAKVPEISRDQVLFMLDHFRNLSMTRDSLDVVLRTFVNRIILYKDKIIIWLNYTNMPPDPEKASIIMQYAKNLSQNNAKTSDPLCSTIEGSGSPILIELFLNL